VANRQNGYDDPILQALVTDNETAETYDFQDAAFSLAYSRYVLDRLSLGATVKFINESIDGESASAFAFDFGSVYDVGIYGWSLAARISNIGSDMSYFNQDNPLPLVFSIGSTIHPVTSEEYDLMIAVDATKAMDSEQHLYGGAELGFYDLLFLRAGYKYNYSGASDDGTSFRDPIDTTIEGFSAGAGIQYDLQTANVAVDYAYTQMELLDAVNRITLRISR
jgi:opacity protein-like surface antigen